MCTYTWVGRKCKRFHRRLFNKKPQSNAIASYFVRLCRDVWLRHPFCMAHDSGEAGDSQLEQVQASTDSKWFMLHAYSLKTDNATLSLLQMTSRKAGVSLCGYTVM